MPTLFAIRHFASFLFSREPKPRVLISVLFPSGLTCKQAPSSSIHFTRYNDFFCLALASFYRWSLRKDAKCDHSQCKLDAQNHVAPAFSCTSSLKQHIYRNPLPLETPLQLVALFSKEPILNRPPHVLSLIHISEPTRPY